MTIGDTIMASLNAIRTKGWCAGIRHDSHGKVCAIGAVECALYGLNTYETGESHPAFMPTMNALARYLPPVDEWEDRVDPSVRPYLRRWPLQRSPSDDYNETLVALYNNSHTQQEVEDWFEKAALNEGLTV